MWIVPRKGGEMKNMSTRSQILFQAIYLKRDEESRERVSWKNEAQIYRHSDGYPEGVLGDLARFYEWNERNSDVSYTAANFIYFMKKDMEEISLKNPMSKEGRNWIQSGYGVEKADHHIHGDEEYIYRITLYDQSHPDFNGWIIEVASVESGDTTFDTANYNATYRLTEGDGLIRFRILTA